MKNNSGITIITLIITIIVIVLIASITIYSGLDTVDSIRIKEAKDNTNAIYLALIANENIIPSGSGDGKSIADYKTVVRRTLDNTDFELLGLDYTTDNCKVVFDKIPSGDNEIVYNFTYTNNLNKTFDNLIYSIYVENSKINAKVEFDSVNGVNRPIIFLDEMTAIGYNGENIENVYVEKWYNYQKNVSHLATVTCNGETFVWIPRFAYKIQNFYLGKSYKNVPDTAIDIVFLREDSDYMSNNEVLQSDYIVHPAFSLGQAGFWISTQTISNANSISYAIDGAKNFINGYSYLMRNSEYAAAVLLSKYLNNNQIIFDGEEFVAAVCDGTIEDCDIYSTNYVDINNITSLQGYAMMDTPWDLKVEPTLPNSSLKFMVRDVTTGGVFYYKATDGNGTAKYRVVLKK